MKVTIITVFNIGDINELKDTIDSVQEQTEKPYEHILVISGVINKELLKAELDYQEGIFILNEDKSLYDAMNIGLFKASGDLVYFLNGGDRFYSDTSLENIILNIKDYDGLIFRTIQYFNNIGFIRPKIEKLDLLYKYPAHQGFIIKTLLAKQYLFNDAPGSIASDFFWMKQLINESNIMACREILTYFALGGISNTPSLLSCKQKYIETGLFKAFKEFVKLSLYLLLKKELYYKLIYSRSCELIYQIDAKLIKH